MASGRIIGSPRLGSIPFGVWLHSLRCATNRDDMRRMVERMVANGLDILIPCTFPLSYNEQAQEWPLWLREGYLDLAIPMTYSTIPAETHYYTVNHVALHRDAGHGELWEGICSHRIDGEFLTTIARHALQAGASGLVVFDYPDLTDAKFAAMRAALAPAKVQ